MREGDAVEPGRSEGLWELRMDDIRVLMPVIDTD